MDERIVARCEEFVNDKEQQRLSLAVSLKMQIAQERKFEEVGRRLGEYKPFVDYFYNDMMSKYNSPAAFYRHSHISRQVFNCMGRDDYDPKIETVYKVLIGLKVNILDATILMENAGYTFTFKTITQLVIIFCILNKIYATDDVDALLFHFDQETLFSIR